MNPRAFAGQMREVARIHQSRNVDVVVQYGLCESRMRVDLRRWIGSQPLRKGVSVPADLIPLLVAALADLERTLVRTGVLALADYKRHGLVSPCDFPGTD